MQINKEHEYEIIKKPMRKNQKEFYDVDNNESEEHDREVMNQFFYLRRNGYFLAIRQKLINGKKPDIAILSTPELITKEVMKTESEKRLEEKDYLGAKKIKVKV